MQPVNTDPTTSPDAYVQHRYLQIAIKASDDQSYHSSNVSSFIAAYLVNPSMKPSSSSSPFSLFAPPVFFFCRLLGVSVSADPRFFAQPVLPPLAEAEAEGVARGGTLPFLGVVGPVEGAKSLSLRLMLPRVTEAEPGVYCLVGGGG